MLEETPVPSVRDVCKRLGITVRFMDVYFPATRSLIAQQHRRALSIERARRRELLFREALNIATELHSQGLYPSHRRIFERLPKETIRQWKIRGEATRVAQETLGILR